MKSNADENYKRVEIVRTISCYSYIFSLKSQEKDAATIRAINKNISRISQDLSLN
jgi:hypothetical protein